MTDKKPFEIARETLKQLTTRKMVPTPINYQTIYNEIAGIPQQQPFPADTLRDISKALPGRTPGQQKQKGLLDYAIDRLNWEGVKTALVAYGGFVPTTPEAAGVTEASASSNGAAAAAVGGVSVLTAEFMGQMGKMIEYLQPALGNDDDRLVEQTTMLLKALRQPKVDLAAVKLMLVNYSHRVSFAAEDQAEIKKTLLKLLHLAQGTDGCIDDCGRAAADPAPA
jgi:diguanylate cyclase